METLPTASSEVTHSTALSTANLTSHTPPASCSARSLSLSAQGSGAALSSVKLEAGTLASTLQDSKLHATLALELTS